MYISHRHPMRQPLPAIRVNPDWQRMFTHGVGGTTLSLYLQGNVSYGKDCDFGGKKICNTGGQICNPKASNPRVPKIMIEGDLCRESERAIATALPGDVVGLGECVLVRVLLFGCMVGPPQCGHRGVCGCCGCAAISVPVTVCGAFPVSCFAIG